MKTPSEKHAEPELDSASLPPGTQVGQWKVKGVRGRGTYGTVYRAVRVGDPASEPVALKLAFYVGDKRFEREAELLSRVCHPSVPRLLGQGAWQHPLGRSYPYIVMKWVEGVPLYEWAAQRNPSSREILRVLAQVLRALEATHAVGGSHRDIKGENVLVRPRDGRVFVLDFGAGYYAGATTLTDRPLPPGTPAYRSPESWVFALSSFQDRTAHYEVLPWDEVFAVGVMAYRLVTDEYPPFTDPSMEEGRCWREGGAGPRPPRMLNRRVSPQLNAFIVRMLSVRPEERGFPDELAWAMERGAEHGGPEEDAPLFAWEVRERAEVWPVGSAAAEEAVHRPRYRDREVVRAAIRADAATMAETEPPEGERLERAPAPPERAGARPRWPLLFVAAGGVLLLCPGEPAQEEGITQWEQGAPDAGGRDGGPAGVGETVLTAPANSVSTASEGRGFALEMPKKPFPGQLKPDATGRCPGGKLQIAINGGCWLKVDADPEDCAEAYVYEGGCYAPLFPSPRHPTSEPGR